VRIEDVQLTATSSRRGWAIGVAVEPLSFSRHHPAATGAAAPLRAATPTEIRASVGLLARAVAGPRRATTASSGVVSGRVRSARLADAPVAQVVFDRPRRAAVLGLLGDGGASGPRWKNVNRRSTPSRWATNRIAPSS
jgi:hypothetical protein